ncbi:hypothetical protein FE783_10890 [Paenibacillus mesophilus]|uniref:nicotianamine synthase family protein n=1 Tax=Paenibacillus mesophilus TaxID=2582849 RepID=UPI00110F30EE|nr:nicotianamine synthase family protein [Paenibacillus mesophilus]TMV50062.1 hypothetical protein FE783_10890 [Paenibacillus mesophilus]
MREKYAFLLSLKTIQFEIEELTEYAKTYPECCELLCEKLNEVSNFIRNEDNERLWGRWGNDEAIQQCGAKLRETTARALCTVEKLQSIHTYGNPVKLSDYGADLAASVKEETQAFQIGRESKVLFIGAGSFPISAMTIALETGAEVLCSDIDAEAVCLGRHMVQHAGLESNIRYTATHWTERSFLQKATHIVIASLVPSKSEVIDRLKPLLHAEAKIMVRYGNGLKSLFNYPLEEDLSEAWEVDTYKRKNGMYDTLVLEAKASLVNL